jgi:hypothetical protein
MARASGSPAVEGRTSFGRSRWRPWLLLLGISVAWKVVVLTLGAAVPRWLIDDGVEHIPAAMQPYANQARATALSLWGRPIERTGIIRLVRVVSVDTVVGGDAGDCGGKPEFGHTRSSRFRIPRFGPSVIGGSWSTECSAVTTR